MASQEDDKAHHGSGQTATEANVEAWRNMTALLAQKKKRRFLIDPRTSIRLAWWDSAGGSVLVFTALITPFEVAFLPPDDTPLSARFVANRFIDVFFLCDMLLQLMIMYPSEHVPLAQGSSGDEPKALVQRTSSQLEMVRNHRSIAMRYLRGWFAIDLISVLTCLIDILPFIMSTRPSNEDAIDSLRILRVLRVMRLIKLVRLLKTSRLLTRWQTSIALDNSTQTILSTLSSYLVAGHWFACLLVLTTTVADTPLHTWLGAKGYCVRADDPSATLRPGAHWELQPVPHLPSLAHLDNVYCVSAFDLWCASYFWMIQIVSGTAGGE